MVRLREGILAILYYLSLGANSVCPSGLILSGVAYKRSLATSFGFDIMSSAFNSYDPDIANDATDGVFKKIEREYTATLTTQQLIRACKYGFHSFILKVGEETWVRRLRDPDFFYTQVAPKISSVLSQLTVKGSSKPTLLLC